MKIRAKYIQWILFVICLLPIVNLSLRILVYDRFTISGESMSPEFRSGDVVWVNKLIIGPRIYKSLDFTSSTLSSFRLPGFRELKIDDVVIFNSPFGRGNKKIEFQINYVYAKRVLGCPGDTIGIDNSYYYNRGYEGAFGDMLSQEDLLHTKPDDLGYNIETFPRLPELGWTIYNMGPLTVPEIGMEIELDYLNTHLYALAIEAEVGAKPIWKDGKCVINGEYCKKYKFKNDYYYLVGDNVINSLDSRCFGFVPKEYIVGVVVAKYRRK